MSHTEIIDAFRDHAESMLREMHGFAVAAGKPVLMDEQEWEEEVLLFDSFRWDRKRVIVRDYYGVQFKNPDLEAQIGRSPEFPYLLETLSTSLVVANQTPTAEGVLAVLEPAFMMNGHPADEVTLADICDRADADEVREFVWRLTAMLHGMTTHVGDGYLDHFTQQAFTIGSCASHYKRVDIWKLMPTYLSRLPVEQAVAAHCAANPELFAKVAFNR